MFGYHSNIDYNRTKWRDSHGKHIVSLLADHGGLVEVRDKIYANRYVWTLTQVWSTVNETMASETRISKLYP